MKGDAGRTRDWPFRGSRWRESGFSTGRDARAAASAAELTLQPKSGSYPIAGSRGGGLGGPMTGAMRSLM